MEETVPEHTNTEITGLAAVSGLVMGLTRIYSRGNININPQPLDQRKIPEEKHKFEQARKSVGLDIRRLADFAHRREDSQTHDILQAQYEILQDPELSTGVNRLIEEKSFRAEKAVYDTFQTYVDLIKSANKAFMVSRLTDLRDVRDRLINNIQQLAIIATFGKDAVMVTEDVSPLEVVTFARNGVRGIICNAGGLTSHASIIANAMGIPMLIDAKNATRLAREGEPIILDGYGNKAIVMPDEEVAGRYSRVIKRHEEEEKFLQSLIDKPPVTRCGEKITLQANIDFEDEVLNIGKYRAEGIGLLRTDAVLLNEGFVSMDSQRQQEFCQTAFSGSGSDPVTVRLLDVGGDKVLDIKTRESNPFLGWRGVRVLLGRRELLRNQLDAICRVGGQYPGRGRILVPMISTLDEYLEVKEEFENLQEQLSAKGIPVDRNLEMGVMVEVPSVALQASLFAEHVDFFSIGTNDLTQYTLAVDRGNNLIASLFQPLHPAVLTFIRMTVEAGRAKGVPVSVCGELASDPFAALILIGLGVRELSMTPRLIPVVKQVLRLHSLSEMQNLTEKMLECSTVAESGKIRTDWEQTWEQKRMEERILQSRGR